MRNRQLIRQWAILKIMADTEMDPTIEDLSRIFLVSTKTIRRDLSGLKDVGFLQDEKLDTQFMRETEFRLERAAETNRMAKKVMDEVFEAVDRMRR